MFVSSESQTDLHSWLCCNCSALSVKDIPAPSFFFLSLSLSLSLFALSLAIFLPLAGYSPNLLVLSNPLSLVCDQCLVTFHIPSSSSPHFPSCFSIVE